METVSIMGLGLLIFGILFNALISWVETRPLGHDGYTAFLVVIGVAVTVAATLPILGFRSCLVLLFAFGCSGSPMIMGSVMRYIRQRDHDARVIMEQMEKLEDHDA